MHLKPSLFIRAGLYDAYSATVSTAAQMCHSPMQSCAKIGDWLNSLSGLVTITKSPRWLILLLPMEKALPESVCPEDASGFPKAWLF